MRKKLVIAAIIPVVAVLSLAGTVIYGNQVSSGGEIAVANPTPGGNNVSVKWDLEQTPGIISIETEALEVQLTAQGATDVAVSNDPNEVVISVTYALPERDDYLASYPAQQE